MVAPRMRVSAEADKSGMVVRCCCCSGCSNPKEGEETSAFLAICVPLCRDQGVMFDGWRNHGLMAGLS